MQLLRKSLAYMVQLMKSFAPASFSPTSVRMSYGQFQAYFAAYHSHSVVSKCTYISPIPFCVSSKEMKKNVGEQSLFCFLSFSLALSLTLLVSLYVFGNSVDTSHIFPPKFSISWKFWGKSRLRKINLPSCCVHEMHALKAGFLGYTLTGKTKRARYSPHSYQRYT